MPLSASVLASAIKAKRLAASYGTGFAPVDGDALEADCRAIAEAVVEHITAAAVVVPTLMLAPPGIVGGPVTGTGVVT